MGADEDSCHSNMMHEFFDFIFELDKQIRKASLMSLPVSAAMIHEKLLNKQI